MVARAFILGDKTLLDDGLNNEGLVNDYHPNWRNTMWRVLELRHSNALPLEELVGVAFAQRPGMKGAGGL